MESTSRRRIQNVVENLLKLAEQKREECDAEYTKHILWVRKAFEENASRFLNEQVHGQANKKFNSMRSSVLTKMHKDKENMVPKSPEIKSRKRKSDEAKSESKGSRKECETNFVKASPNPNPKKRERLPKLEDKMESAGDELEEHLLEAYTASCMKLTVKILRVQLKKAGLSVSGRKAVLAERLATYQLKIHKENSKEGKTEAEANLNESQVDSKAITMEEEANEPLANMKDLETQDKSCLTSRTTSEAEETVAMEKEDVSTTSTVNQTEDIPFDHSKNEDHSREESSNDSGKEIQQSHPSSNSNESIVEAEEEVEKVQSTSNQINATSEQNVVKKSNDETPSKVTQQPALPPKPKSLDELRKKNEAKIKALKQSKKLVVKESTSDDKQQTSSHEMKTYNSSPAQPLNSQNASNGGQDSNFDVKSLSKSSLEFVLNGHDSHNEQALTEIIESLKKSEISCSPDEDEEKLISHKSEAQAFERTSEMKNGDERKTLPSPFAKAPLDNEARQQELRNEMEARLERESYKPDETTGSEGSGSKKKPASGGFLGNIVRGISSFTDQTKTQPKEFPKPKKPIKPISALEKAKQARLEQEQKEKERQQQRALNRAKMLQNKRMKKLAATNSGTLEKQPSKNRSNTANKKISSKQGNSMTSGVTKVENIEKTWDPADNYVISDKGESSSEEGDSSDDGRSRKYIPRWARSEELGKTLQTQFGGEMKVDPDGIFGEIQHCDLEAIFNPRDRQRRRKYRIRGSSAMWARDGLTIKETKQYRKDMGLE